MLTFEYQARDPQTGKKITAAVEADSEQSAAKLIAAQGFSPIKITLNQEGSGLIGQLRSRVGTKDKIIFSRQLSTLINAGLPLLQSLRTITDQTKSKNLVVVLNRVISDVEAGSSLSAAIARFPRVFNQVFVSLVAAGETSGTLDKSLERIAGQQEKDAELISKVRGAMIYPIVVLLVMGGVVTFMLVSVLPQVQELYKGLPGARLPFLTVLLLAISNFIIHFWWLILVIVGMGGFFSARWIQSGPGRSFADKAKISVPPFKLLFMKMYMSRFARTGSTLVSSGVPLLQVLQITSHAINNVHIAASLDAAAEKVKGGKALSAAIEKDENFLSLVPNMLRIGEQSGQIEQMLAKTADYYEKEVDTQVKTISTIIEPVLMIMLGGVTLIIVGAVLLPIYSLVGSDALQ